MKIEHWLPALIIICIGSLCIVAQTPIVVNDPTVDAAEWKLSAAEQAIMDEKVLPEVREKRPDDLCEEPISVAGILQGAFTRAGARQTLIFYQFCQTGNGLGSAGVAVVEDGEVAANVFCAECGWTIDAKVLPDINQNGLNEVALYYSGGMHQGSGGTGVNIHEFSRGNLKGIGWFQAESFSETGPVTGYRVTVKPGKVSAFTREKYLQNASGKWRKAGMPAPLKLTSVIGEFEPIK